MATKTAKPAKRSVKRPPKEVALKEREAEEDRLDIEAARRAKAESDPAERRTLEDLRKALGR